MIVLEGVPSKGYDWGWFSREDPRMHLQIVNRKFSRLGYKVWLERDGKRVFDPSSELTQAPRKLQLAFQARVEEDRPDIERQWAAFMILQTWIGVRLSGSVITITAYPRYPGRFTRTVDLADELPGIYDPDYPATPKDQVKPEQIALNHDLPALEIWPDKPKSRRHHLYLPDILWQD